MQKSSLHSCGDTVLRQSEGQSGRKALVSSSLLATAKQVRHPPMLPPSSEGWSYLAERTKQS